MTIKQLMRLYIGDINDKITRHKIESQGEGKIICSEVNNTPSDIDHGHLICWYEGKEYRLVRDRYGEITFITRKLLTD